VLNRILLIVDAFLVGALVLLALRFHAVWTAPADLAAARPDATGPGDFAAPTASPLSPSAGLPLSAFSTIATNNLFSPLRTEEAPPPSPAMTPQRHPAPVLPRPRLYGIVLGTEGGARAFLDDPRTRKVTGYTVGDSVGDSRLDEIKPDRVVLRRGSEVFEVLLHDPSKPRPVAAPAPPVPTAPGALPGGSSLAPDPPGMPVDPGIPPTS
jgi:Type II secretion system protein C